MRHKVFRQTRGKVPIKHGSTLFDNTGPGVGSFFRHLIWETDVGARSGNGLIKVIKDQADTGNECNVGDVVKYVNICIQCSPRGADSTNLKDDCGFLEWAIYWEDQTTVAMGVANIGTDTLGVLSGRTYRQDAIYSGCLPLGSRQALSTDLHIKIPKRMCRLRLGSRLNIICYARGSSSTDTRTDSFRLVVSSQFKAYS